MQDRVGVDWAREVLDFWFRQTPDEKHFAQDAALDAEISRRFGALHERLAAGGVEISSVYDALAAIVALDQFSRNMFRGEARAFAQDDAALRLAKDAIARGWDALLVPRERHFLYMPFMHSEDLAEAERSVALIATLGLPSVTDFARRHRDVIARFGRYPSRNAALERASTPEEAAFLAANPEGFSAFTRSP